MTSKAKNKLIIIFFVLFFGSCINHYHIQPPVKVDAPEKKEVKRASDLGRYKFDLTDKEREMNKDNEFLKYLETGKGGYKAVKRSAAGNRHVSEGQRKAVKR